MTKNKTKVILSDADIIGRKSAKILFSDQTIGVSDQKP